MRLSKTVGRIGVGKGRMVKEYIERLNIAQAHFDWATDPDDVDVAIYELKAAEIAMSYFIKCHKAEGEE